MSRATHTLIAELVDSLEPVRPLRFYSGLGLTLAALGLTVATVALLFGVRADLVGGNVDPMFLLATGLFLLLGLASAVTAIIMSQPRVGSDHQGWVWAAAMTALLPLAAGLVWLGRGSAGLSDPAVEHGLDCLSSGGALGLLAGGVLVWWLRRGAPTSPGRAGLLTGVAAGCFGIFSFSLHCGDNDIVHIGLWHGAVVMMSGAIGRIAVPRLIRW